MTAFVELSITESLSRQISFKVISEITSLLLALYSAKVHYQIIWMSFVLPFSYSKKLKQLIVATLSSPIAFCKRFIHDPQTFYFTQNLDF